MMDTWCSFFLFSFAAVGVGEVLAEDKVNVFRADLSAPLSAVSFCLET